MYCAQQKDGSVPSFVRIASKLRDGHGYIDSARRPDQDYKYLMGSDMLKTS